VIRAVEGLGLANPTLEFLEPGAEEGPKSARLPAPASRSQERTATIPTPAPRTPTPAPLPAPADVWYVRTEAADGTVQTRKMTTQQVLLWIGEAQFDPATQVSRQPHGNFRTLATYREFQGAVLGRAARSGADRQASKFRKQYRQIEAAELKRAERKVEEPAETSATYWFGIFWRVAAVVGVVGVLILIGVVLVNALKGVFW
jgi:hypothetical protein